MTPIKKASRDPFDFPLERKSFTYKGVTYTFRELTLAENDTCREAAEGPDGSFDGRMMMRTMITLSAVDPEIDSETLMKFPNRLYSKIIDIVNDLNDADLLTEDGKDEDPGNS